MALNAPDYFAGANDPLRGGTILLQFTGWIRRRCNEITAETELDVFKFYDLAANCYNFRAEADKWIDAGEVTAVLDVLVDLTRQATGTSKTTAQINQDYKDLYAATGAFLSWFDANLPGQGQTITSPTVTVNRTYPNTDLVVTATKPAAVTTQVNNLLAIFA